MFSAALSEIVRLSRRMLRQDRIYIAIERSCLIVLACHTGLIITFKADTPKIILNNPQCIPFRSFQRCYKKSPKLRPRAVKIRSAVVAAFRTVERDAQDA